MAYRPSAKRVSGEWAREGSRRSVAEYENFLFFFFSQVAGELVKGKPTYVAIGDLVGLPYADKIGLSADL